LHNALDVVRDAQYDWIYILLIQIKAKEIALGETKGGIVAKSNIEEDNGMQKYDMIIIKQNEEFTVEINATTGKVLDFEQK